MANFSLDNLTTDPNFDFLHTLMNRNSDDDNDFLSTGSPYSSADFSCSYMCETQLIEKMKTRCNPFVLSVNIQSLQSKFNDLQALISSLLVNKCAPDLICLQEIWRIPGSEFFNLDGYHPLEYLSRQFNVQGGGVGIFVKKNLNFSINKSFKFSAIGSLNQFLWTSLLIIKKLQSDHSTGREPNTPPYLVANNLRNFANFSLPLQMQLIIVTILPIFLAIPILIASSMELVQIQLIMSTCYFPLVCYKLFRNQPDVLTRLQL